MLEMDRLGKFVDQCWGDAIVPTLVEYIRIPNKSPAFDPDWAAHGYMDEAVELFEGWARERLAGAARRDARDRPAARPHAADPDRGTRQRRAAADESDTVLLYGHLDKQPEMVGWAEGYGPWMPRLDGDKLYGRGGADDGYAMFGALTALLGAARPGAPHARCVVLIEACEESGSYDLPYYIEHLADRIGRPSLVICLDSGCGNYDQLWMTTSLRGIAAGTLTVEVLEEGVHSGDASGVVPSSFRILRQLLSRLEDESDRRDPPGRALCPDPAGAGRAGAARRRRRSATTVYTKFPFAPRHAADDATISTELVLNRTWRPQLAVTGIDGLPQPGDAGNVLLPYTTAKLQPAPAADPRRRGGRRDAARRCSRRPALWRQGRASRRRRRRAGWNAPALAPWLEAVAGARLRERIRRAAGLYGRRRQHPVHGDARRKISRGAVCRDRRARAAFQRAWA